MDEELLSSLWLQLCDQVRVIRDSRQWIGEGGTWDNYCKTRWSLSKSRANLYYRFSKFAQMCREADMPPPTSPDNVAPILQLTQKRWINCYRYCLNFVRPQRLTAQGCKNAMEHAGVVARKKPPQHVITGGRVRKAAKLLADIGDGEALVEQIGPKGLGKDWPDATRVVIDAEGARLTSERNG